MNGKFSAHVHNLEKILTDEPNAKNQTSDEKQQSKRWVSKQNRSKLLHIYVLNLYAEQFRLY